MLLSGCNTSVDVQPAEATVQPTSAESPSVQPPSINGLFAPVRIKAGGEFIAVEAPGYACPTMADVDGDGREDLIVGQFSGGNMQFCRNIAKTNETPAFDKPEWLMTGDERAIVPGVW